MLSHCHHLGEKNLMFSKLILFIFRDIGADNPTVVEISMSYIWHNCWFLKCARSKSIHVGVANPTSRN